MPSQSARLHQLTTRNDILGDSELYPTAFVWSSALDHSDQAYVLVYSHTFLDADACLSLIGTPVHLTTLSASREPTDRCGLITATTYQHSDGAIHFYTLRIVTPDWQLTQNIRTRSFVNQSTLDIITTVLSDYSFDWQLSEHLLSSSNTLQRPLAMRTQSDISDHDFMIGLLADSGIFTYWVHGDSLDQLGYWLLTEQVDDSALPALRFSYEHSSVGSGQDSVDQLQMSARKLGASTVIVRADGLATDTIFEGVADDDSLLAVDDTAILIAAPSRVTSDMDATRLARLWVAATACHRDTFVATGAMRGMSVGSPVSIYNLPCITDLSAYCLSLQTIGIEPNSNSVSYSHQSMIQDWLQQTTTQRSLSLPSHAYESARSTGVWVSATLLDASIPYCPYPSKQSFVSSTYSGLTQARTGDTSTSATPSYASTVTDDGQQQTVTTPVWAGISPHDDGATPPLRSLQLSSGSSHGWQFAPRVGQPVLLTHWYGDIDSPVISRSLYDGIGMGDTDEADITIGSSEPSNRHNIKGGSSPRWHGSGLGYSQINDDDDHSGWMTGIAQYGLTSDTEVSLLFDDSPNQIGTQWSMNTGSRANAMTPIMTSAPSSATFSPHQHVLEIGVLRHRYSNHHSSISGHGFRVATDNSLQVIGDQGLLLSSFGIRHTQSEHESAWVNDAGVRQLKIGEDLSETLAEAKGAHLQSTQAIQSAKEVLEEFKDSAQIMDETLNTEVLGASDVLLVSKDSLLTSGTNTLWTATDIIRQSGSTQSDMVAGSYTLSANTIESLSGVGGQASSDQGNLGLHMSANREPLAIQAQGGELRLNSQQSMTIGSEAGVVNVSSPKRIKLQTSAGASITIDGDGVKLVAPGEIKVMAVKKALVSGAKVNAPVIALPVSGLFSKAFDLKKLLPQDLIDQGISYKLINHSKGTEFEGKLDEDGQTLRVFGDKAEKVELELIDAIGLEYEDLHYEDEPDDEDDCC